jgi:hypothetical protein|tara:strand:+ start:97 stop:618 length:522 start_codon:yes stop_codon:yes gene_type:complete
MEKQTQKTSLIKAIISSLVIAVIALVLFILPAEYNIDPTGVGATLGLTVFNESLNEQKKIVEPTRNNLEKQKVLLTIPVGRGVEYKLAMAQFEKVSYQWQTNQGRLYVDLHGEPKGDTSGYFESYTIATVDHMKGSFTAPFAGSHGWYWKNTTDKAIEVQLTFTGQYIVEGLK